MPGLTIATDARPASASGRGTTANPRRSTSTTSPTTRTSSPPRPPVSPITPTLGPTQLPGGPTTTTTVTTTSSKSSNNNSNDAIPDFALGRPSFTHATQADQVGVAPLAAQPIDFDDNPDVLALKSAISILQLQRARATADIQSLNRTKHAALADPEAFAADLAAGRVRADGDPLFSAAGMADSEDDDDDDDDDDEDEYEEGTPSSDTPMTDATEGTPTPIAHPGSSTTANPNRKGKQRAADTNPPAWRRLPKPQTVVRCPPINWAQYGVVGESLNKLHAEQIAAPNLGAPAVLGAGGTYEFKAGDQAGAGGGGEPPRRLVGIAAPYTPGRDKIEKKGKGGKR